MSAVERVRMALAAHGVRASADDVRAAARVLSALSDEAWPPQRSEFPPQPLPLRWARRPADDVSHHGRTTAAPSEAEREEIARLLERDARRVQRGLNCYIRLPRVRDMLEGSGSGPLAARAIAIKDIIAQTGVPMTCGGSGPAMRPRVDADVVRRLRAAGAMFAGRTNMHEFAYGISNDNPHFGPARNPWDPSRIPGGSSGGNAIAIAVGCAFGAIGTDTGGSIRVPAALCGVAGLKPTYDAVSRAGVFPLSWSLDHVGPMARTAADTALIFEAIARRPVRRATDRGLRGVRIGVLRGEHWERCDPDVHACFGHSVRALRATGATVRAIRSRDDGALAAIGSAILLTEAAMVHRERMKRRGVESYGRDVRVRLLAGLAVGAAEYGAIVARRRELTRGWVRDVFSRADVVVTPTAPLVATKIGEAEVRVGAEAADAREAFTRFTRPFNALGIPALSVPAGLITGLPVGLQIVGPPWADALVLRVGIAFERESSARGVRPS